MGINFKHLGLILGFILGFIFILIAILIIWRWMYLEVVFQPSFLFLFLPGGGLLVSQIIKAKGKPLAWYYLSNIIVFISLPLCALFGIFGVEFWLVNSATVTRVARYQECVTQLGDLTSHFPRKIPQNAQNIHFSYSPHFLQGGSSMHLSYSLPKDEIAEIFMEFETQKTCSRGSNSHSLICATSVRVSDGAHNGESFGLDIDKENNTIDYWAKGG